MNKAIVAALLRTAKKAYDKDRSNRYALLEPWTLPLLNVEVPRPFDNALLSVEPAGKKSRWTFKPHDGSACDGASLAPDSPKGVIPAALAHDPLYLSIPELSAAFGWTEGETRKVCDAILSTVMLDFGADPLVVRLYYNAVYWLGGVFRLFKRALPVLAASALASSNGCLAPVDLTDPGEKPDAPKYEKVA